MLVVARLLVGTSASLFQGSMPDLTFASSLIQTLALAKPSVRFRTIRARHALLGLGETCVHSFVLVCVLFLGPTLLQFPSHLLLL